MCFSKKMKVPKPNMDQKAPEPILLEPPKGIEMGDGPDDATDTDTTSSKGRDSVTIKKTGEGTQSSTSTDTGATKKKPAAAGIKRAMKR
ncbi:virion structural protein [Pseudomonas phage 71PfluR64PP]|uniref:Uncharacterized protein n=2 Tax=Pfluvirus TaxID=3424962 RepID=A0A2Z4QIQ2_9CAUD|nr:hypothetical protein HOT51_gp28 [Pseudomonas phage PFP1]AWH14709.1 virion structural protein [Pseudomonas phage 71PfluR64PP]AWY10478.1 hypothetical protein PFP1_28 [Pseudomonas phage PFP1]